MRPKIYPIPNPPTLWGEAILRDKRGRKEEREEEEGGEREEEEGGEREGEEGREREEELRTVKYAFNEKSSLKKWILVTSRFSFKFLYWLKRNLP